jgi:hypothetical protein
MAMVMVVCESLWPWKTFPDMYCLQERKRERERRDSEDVYDEGREIERKQERKNKKQDYLRPVFKVAVRYIVAIINDGV